MKNKLTFSFRALTAASLLLLAQGGFAQSFSTCTGQTVLTETGSNTAVTGATSTVTNNTGSSVNIKITARGGDGGTRTGQGAVGGTGATMIGEFVLASGATLRSIASGVDQNASGNSNAGGGSGAVNCGDPSDCATGTILIIAAGGNGGGIRLFPNPATGTVTLALQSDYTGEATLTLYDLLGKQMKTQVLSLEGGSFRTSIELTGLPGGVYLMEVQAPKRQAGLQQWRERLVVE